MAETLGTTAHPERYHAYGSTRSSTTLPYQDYKFTGQLSDGTGLVYMNARYYDPAIGQFISPDTIVPNPDNLQDYNRYMYVRGNPLKYNDPTGHYSDEEIMQHYGCSDWACVEAIFGDGGAMAGMRGWLFILMAAQNGDSVSILSTSQLGGQNTSNWTQGTIQFQGGRISVQNVATRLGQADGSMSWASLSGDTFATFAFMNNNTETFSDNYLLSGSNTQVRTINDTTLDCSHVDCTAARIDAVGTAASAVSVGCAVAGAAPCVPVARLIAGGAGLASLAWSGYQFREGNINGKDLTVDIAVFAVGEAVGDRAYGIPGLAIDLFAEPVIKRVTAK